MAGTHVRRYEGKPSETSLSLSTIISQYTQEPVEVVWSMRRSSFRGVGEGGEGKVKLDVFKGFLAILS